MDTAARCILFAVFTLFSAYFEMVCTSLEECNRIRIKQLSEEKDKRAIITEKLLSVYKEAFFTLKTAKVASVTAMLYLMYKICIEGRGEVNALVLSVLVTALVLVLFCAYLPSSLARAASDKIILTCAIPSLLFTLPVLPLTLVFALFSRLLALVMPKRKKELAYTSTYTEDEFSDIIEKVEDEGVLLEEESDIIQSAVDFGSVSAEQVMCPIERVFSAYINADMAELLPLLAEGGFSRVPVYKDLNNKNVFCGILLARDLLAQSLSGRVKNIKDFVVSPIYVSPEARLITVMNEMKKRRLHMAIVRDNERRVLGVLTMEDILEELVGDIYDENDISSSEKGEDAI